MSDEYDDNVVDLNAYREQKEKEERERLEQEERDEYEYLSSLVHSFMSNLGDLVSSSMVDYTQGHNPYSSDDFQLTTYYHEAGYDENGYYEKNWEFDPWDFASYENIDDDDPDI